MGFGALKRASSKCRSPPSSVCLFVARRSRANSETEAQTGHFLHVVWTNYQLHCTSTWAFSRKKTLRQSNHRLHTQSSFSSVLGTKGGHKSTGCQNMKSNVSDDRSCELFLRRAGALWQHLRITLCCSVVVDLLMPKALLLNVLSVACCES